MQITESNHQYHQKRKHGKLLLVGKLVNQFLEWGEFTFVDEAEFLHEEDEMFE